MHSKKACLVVNPRAGENVAKLPDVLAVLSAAGWTTKVCLREYCGHAMELATWAAEEGDDPVIAFGGDGTVNQVINGIMNAKGQSSTVAVIPGGTANIWANEVGIPCDPLKAALTLLNSDRRAIDVGYVEVEGLTLPGGAEADSHQKQKKDKKARKKRQKETAKARHHFLLMAGLGLDAAIMERVSKSLKYKIGPLAVGIAAVKELAAQQPFPVEIRASSAGREGEVLWKGEALQIVIGNTRKYAEILEMTPNAYIDDGILDVCVITPGDPLSTVGQIASLVLQRKPDKSVTEYFHDAHLLITVPASIGMEVDGSAVKLDDYVGKSERKALQSAENREQVMVTYRFDALPGALHIAIPRTYDDTLFEKTSDKKELLIQAHEAAKKEQEQAEVGQLTEDNTQQDGNQAEDALDAAIVNALLKRGRKVTVVGAGPDPDKREIYIIAGEACKKNTGDICPVAVRIDDHTTIMKQDGQFASPAIVQELPEGTEVVVEGKKNKRGVISASMVVV